LGGVRGLVLPVVEQIDPSLVPELFWRAVAIRPPIGDPRVVWDWLPEFLVQCLAWYDRQVAEVVLERVRADLDQTDDRTLAATRSGGGCAVRKFYRIQILHGGPASHSPRDPPFCRDFVTQSPILHDCSTRPPTPRGFLA
jgi:hypothetical protein